MARSTAPPYILTNCPGHTHTYVCMHSHMHAHVLFPAARLDLLQDPHLCVCLSVFLSLPRAQDIGYCPEAAECGLLHLQSWATVSLPKEAELLQGPHLVQGYRGGVGFRTDIMVAVGPVSGGDNSGPCWWLEFWSPNASVLSS